MHEYIQEWERLTVLCDVDVTDEMSVGKFIAGFREDIRRRLTLIPDLTIHSAGNRATEIEKNISSKKTTSNPNYNRNNRPYNPRSTYTLPTPRKTTPSVPQKEDTYKPNAPPKDPKDIVCFKCNGRGHYKANCPNARAFTMTEWNEIRLDTRTKVILVLKNGKEGRGSMAKHQ